MKCCTARFLVVGVLCCSLGSFGAAASIRGRVVDDLSGLPIVGARLQISGTKSAIPAVIRSEKEGEFVFADQPPDNYRLSVEDVGYFRLEYAQTIALANTDLTAGELRLIAKRSISGTIRWRDGEPAVGASVHALRIRGGKAPAAFGEIRPVSVDDRGHFQLSDLQPGRYTVYAYKQSIGDDAGLSRRVARPVYFPGVPKPDLNRSLDLNGTIESAPISLILDEGAGVEVSGAVEPSDGYPEGTQVAIGLIIPYLTAQPLLAVAAQVGKPFVFQGVPPGEFALMASASGSSYQTRVVQDIDVSSLPRTGIRISMPPPSTLEGQIEEYDVRAGTKPMQSLSVLALAEKYPTSASTVGISDASGHFVLQGALRAQPYVLSFRAMASDLYISSVTQGRGELTGGTLRVLSAQDGGPINIVVKRNGGRIRGSVIGVRDVSRVFIVLAPKARSAAYWYRTAQPLSDGSYTLAGIAPGAYDLFAFDGNDEDEYLDPAFLDRNADAGLRVNIEADHSYSCELSLTKRR